MSIIEFLSQPVWQRLGLTLVHFLWQGLGVAILISACIRVFKLKHGKARYAVYLLALAAMIACPVVTFISIDTAVSPEVEVVTEAESAELLDITLETALPRGDIPSEADTSGSVMPGPATTTSSISLPKRIYDNLRISLPWLLVIWMIGVIILSVRLLMGFVGVYRWRRHLEPLPVLQA